MVPRDATSTAHEKRELTLTAVAWSLDHMTQSLRGSRIQSAMDLEKLAQCLDTLNIEPGPSMQ